MTRTRLAPERQPPETSGEGRWRDRRVIAALLVGATLPAWLGGGVPAAAGFALAALFVLLRRRAPALWLAGLLLVAGPVVVAVSLQLDRGADQPIADLLTGTGLTLAIGSILVRPGTRLRPEPAPT